jgi:hypothetical protein
MPAVQSVEGLASGNRNAGSGSEGVELNDRKKAEKAAKKKKKAKAPKAKAARKYYAAAVGRAHGVPTSWDEADRSVSEYSGGGL